MNQGSSRRCLLLQGSPRPRALLFSACAIRARSRFLCEAASFFSLLLCPPRRETSLCERPPFISALLSNALPRCPAFVLARARRLGVISILNKAGVGEPVPFFTCRAGWLFLFLPSGAFFLCSGVKPIIRSKLVAQREARNRHFCRILKRIATVRFRDDQTECFQLIQATCGPKCGRREKKAGDLRPRKATRRPHSLRTGSRLLA